MQGEYFFTVGYFCAYQLFLLSQLNAVEIELCPQVMTAEDIDLINIVGDSDFHDVLTYEVLPSEA